MEIFNQKRLDSIQVLHFTLKFYIGYVAQTAKCKTLNVKCKRLVLRRIIRRNLTYSHGMDQNPEGYSM